MISHLIHVQAKIQIRGKPDEIVENCETLLILDEDVDGNGIMDVDEISIESEESRK